MIKSQRKLFDIPDDIAYFNCAYNSPQLNESQKRLSFGISAKCHPWERIASHLLQLGFQLHDDSQRCPHMFGALIPNDYKGSLVSELREKKVFISQRCKSIRFAPHLHINDNDLERLLNAMNELFKR